MLTRVERINLSVDDSLTLCLDALKDRHYQTTIFGERRLLCVKRSQQEDCVLTLEILIEAFSRYESKITLTGKLSNRCLPGELAGEVCDIAAALIEKAGMQNTQPAAFPLYALQVCIV